MNARYISLLMTSTILVHLGCSKSSDSKSSAQLPIFSVANEEISKLRDVGCDMKDNKVDCSLAASSTAANELQNLKSSKAHFEKQKNAVDEVSASIKKRLKEREFSAVSTIEAQSLLTSLHARSTVLLLQGIDMGIAILNEENYQTVLGYQCVGSFEENQQVTKIDQRMVFSAADQTTTLPGQETGFFGAVQLSGADRKISFKLTDKANAADQNFRLQVQSDGEFIIATKGERKLEMSCLRSRLYSNTKPFTDRPVESNYFMCNVLSKKDGQTRNWRSGFPTSTSALTIDLTQPFIDEEMNSQPSRNKEIHKYGESVTVDKGILKFVISDLATGQTLAEVETTNATKQFQIVFDDNKGGGVAIECKQERN